MLERSNVDGSGTRVVAVRIPTLRIGPNSVILGDHVHVHCDASREFELS